MQGPGKGENRSSHRVWVILPLCFADVLIRDSVRLGKGVVLIEMNPGVCYTK